MIIKVTPAPMGPAIKSLVNIYSYERAHFGDQALAIKKLYYKYNAKRVIIDGNGLGAGLMDFMVKPSLDPETGETLPDFGVYGGTYEDVDTDYKKYETPDCERNAIYVIKANAPINTEAHTTVQTNLTTGKLKFLIDERDAKVKLLGTKVG
jgi:ribonucleoside-diphosphate reductase alpha chain